MGVCESKSNPPNPDAIDLSHFELMKVVGKGGFGKVNAITRLSSNGLYALKRIEKFGVLQSQSHLNMVWVERKIMSVISSPFLCNLIHAFQSDVELFLVMPFMQGGDLRYHLKERGTMTVEQARFYAAELLLALQDLHAKRIVYRDLKPENVLLDAEGHLRISDFGLASILRRENNYLTTGQAGTRGYQSPEVVSNVPYGTEADMWSAHKHITTLLLNIIKCNSNLYSIVYVLRFVGVLE
jgi:serine/threonine protein kinase